MIVAILVIFGALAGLTFGMFCEWAIFAILEKLWPSEVPVLRAQYPVIGIDWAREPDVALNPRMPYLENFRPKIHVIGDGGPWGRGDHYENLKKALRKNEIAKLWETIPLKGPDSPYFTREQIEYWNSQLHEPEERYRQEILGKFIE